MNEGVPIDELNRLADLKARGVVNDDEFQELKRKLLSEAPVTEPPHLSRQSVPNGYTFGQAISSGFQNYVTFAGRSPRSEYWFWTLFTVLGSLAATIADVVFGTSSKPGGIGAFYVLFFLGTFLPSMAVTVRRLHDVEKSGWWFWLVLIPVVGWVFLLVWSCSRGTEGENEYGPDPLARPPL